MEKKEIKSFIDLLGSSNNTIDIVVPNIFPSLEFSFQRGDLDVKDVREFFNWRNNKTGLIDSSSDIEGVTCVFYSTQTFTDEAIKYIQKTEIFSERGLYFFYYNPRISRNRRRVLEYLKENFTRINRYEYLGFGDMSRELVTKGGKKRLLSLFSAKEFRECSSIFSEGYLVYRFKSTSLVYLNLIDNFLYFNDKYSVLENKGLWRWVGMK